MVNLLIPLFLAVPVLALAQVPPQQAPKLPQNDWKFQKPEGAPVPAQAPKIFGASGVQTGTAPEVSLLLAQSSAIKSLSARIDELEERIKKLEGAKFGGGKE